MCGVGDNTSNDRPPTTVLYCPSRTKVHLAISFYVIVCENNWEIYSGEIGTHFVKNDRNKPRQCNTLLLIYNRSTIKC